MPPKISFVHCQSFSRKPNRAGQCVQQVIEEGLRLKYVPTAAQLEECREMGKRIGLAVLNSGLAESH